MRDHNIKLNDQKVSHMRFLFQNGWPKCVLTEYFGISIRACDYAIKGESWPDAPMFDVSLFIEKKRGRQPSVNYKTVLGWRLAAMTNSTTFSELAYEHHVSPDTVVRAVRGDTWSWLPGAVKLPPAPGTEESTQEEPDADSYTLHARGVTLLPCPFCGCPGNELCFQDNLLNDGESGFIRCSCGAEILCEAKKERYEHIEGDIYRLVPASTWVEDAAAKWNRRHGRK